jgi:hypothetical protein
MTIKSCLKRLFKLPFVGDDHGDSFLLGDDEHDLRDLIPKCV